ncbi:Mlr9349 protein [hydrothermal vent metagenome]|uniref:Mlr9349 protein n=1 Tax=hydrothermal vent metagenome TaxID=652676 RepID=A0A3B1BKG5_9ZZZZ
MQAKYITRHIQPEIHESLLDFPAVAVLGPRQCGKSTLAKRIIAGYPGAIYLDLEKPADLAKLHEPELFFSQHSGKLVCLDEVQRLPDIFTALRSIIDEQKCNGQFLFLGSASRDLIRQSSETLAGRIAYLELASLSYNEIQNSEESITLNDFWLKGGFPDSLLARNSRASRRWRENFIRTFLERDIPQLGFRIPAPTLRRVWQMCAHDQGRLLNSSKLGSSLGVSHTTFRSYIDLLAETYMLRILPPYIPNMKKRLVKSPKIYLRDSGILHSLLAIDTFDDLMGHPVFGASWETVAMETVIANFPEWEPFFYRTAAGVEIDLILKRGSRKMAFEFKASTAPKVTKGFWNGLNDLNIEKAWVVAPVQESYPIKENVLVCPLSEIATAS